MPVVEIEDATQKIIERSRPYRESYLADMKAASERGSGVNLQSCSGLAHAHAGLSPAEKVLLMSGQPNIAIVSAASEMLSAHQPFYRFPETIKDAAKQYKMTAQIAGHTAAMCDGVTQGQPGMHISLFSRDIIAEAVAIALSHNTFDSVIGLATCDKIKPGFMMGFSAFGHLPIIFAPGGPMETGQSNAAKNAVRQKVARGEAGREEEIASEMKSYHGPGTCTFYGTANGNEMIAEAMGVQLPGSSFIPPNITQGSGKDKIVIPNPEREAMTRAAVQKLAEGIVPKWHEVITEKSIVNAIVALHATGGSTNLVLHLPAIAAMNGIYITLEDIEDLSEAVPSIARIYPNGPADINEFRDAGGMAVLMNNLLTAGLLHDDVKTVAGEGLDAYTKIPYVERDGRITWMESANQSCDTSVITTAKDPFSKTGGIKVMKGRLGEGISKVSSLKEEHRRVSAPARVFETELGLYEAYQKGELKEDFIAVVRGQAAYQVGMPELHKLLIPLKNCQDDGLKVGLVTNGRLSGASGAVPTVIHLAMQDENGMQLRDDDEPINKIQDGDMITIDTNTGELTVDVPEEEWSERLAASINYAVHSRGFGRELFDNKRRVVSAPQTGAVSAFPPLIQRAIP